MLLNVAPAGALVGLMLVVPLMWLLTLSFTDAQGRPTLSNYAQIFAEAAYGRAFGLTVGLALATTAICVVAGYAVAYAMTLMPGWAAKAVMMMVALPFWTSILVRTYAWLILLQNRGFVNTTLQKIGLISEPLALMHNRTGALVGMVHILLPFAVFPLYAALRKVDPDHLRAAAGMAASPLYRFWHVLFPQTLPGVVAACTLVFVLALGFYMTPALLGGGRTVVISILIESEVNGGMSWGVPCALGIVFVAAVLGLFTAVHRFMPVDAIFER